MENYYPPVGFHFLVTFKKSGGIVPEKVFDIRFQSVSGLEVSLETESIKEGGENRFEHVVPLRTKYSTLSLKRGMVTKGNSGVTNWFIQAFKNLIIKPVDLDITLLNENHLPLVNWNVIHAWPKSWKFNELNAEKSEVFLETLELHYNRFEVGLPI